MRRFLSALLVVSFTIILPTQSAEIQKPNVCFILVDDLRPDGIAALGNTVVKTANMDAIVQRGFVFRCAYVNGSAVPAVCLPSRTQLLTGMSAHRAKNEPSGATLDEFTFPKAMRAAGYAAIHCGKDENSPKKVTAEFEVTFDGGHAQANVDRMLEFVHANAGKRPLFLYLAGHEPHDPQYAPDEYYARYDPKDIPLPAAFRAYHPFDNGEMTVRDEQTLPWPRTCESVSGKLARYYGSTHYLDDQIGRLVQALKDAGQFDNTVFVLAGDNGLSLGEHGLLGKQNVYEFGGMHVPLVFAGPGIPKGETHSFAYLYDIFPTVCALTQTPVPARVDGKNLLPIMTGKASKVRDYAFTWYKNIQRAVRTDAWKLIRYPQIGKTQLFDLMTDPHEERDLAKHPEMSEKLTEMLELLGKAQKEYGDTCPLTAAKLSTEEWTPEK